MPNVPKKASFIILVFVLFLFFLSFNVVRADFTEWSSAWDFEANSEGYINGNPVITGLIPGDTYDVSFSESTFSSFKVYACVEGGSPCIENSGGSFTMPDGYSWLSIYGYCNTGSPCHVQIDVINKSITPTPAPAPSLTNISNLAVSVTDTKAYISWTTDVNATGQVDYGITDAYDTTATDSNLSTTRTINLTGLSANTVYHYQVSSTDAGNNTVQSTDNTFTTALAGTTTPVITTVTTTTTTTVTNTKVVMPPADKTGPSVSISTDFTKPFKVAPEITGSASDPSRVVKVEYSVDGGANWLPADSGNLGEKTAKFTFTPDISEDGNYKIVVRAMDGAGNRALSKAYTLVIDRLPPLIGGNIWSIGPVSLLPDANGIITTLAGVDNKITTSAIGGPISIDLSVNESTYPFDKSVSSGLWSGTVNFKSPGLYTIKARSVDGAGNITERDLNTVLVLDSGSVMDKETGKPLPGAKLSVFELDSASKIWNLWDGKSFGQNGTQSTGDTGRYSYYLPPGTYYLTVEAAGYKTVTSNIFKLNIPSALSTDFEMKPAAKIQIGPFSFTLPDIFFYTAEITVNVPKTIATEENKNKLISTEAPDFILPTTLGNELNLISLRGKSQIIIFLNTWLPQSSEQISQVASLDEKYRSRVLFIVSEESLSKVQVFAGRGGYQGVTIAADPDGTLVSPYRINSLPTSYFIDRKGVIQKVISGVVSGSDIINYLDNN